jgi:GDPmannose 4,6-dehydratase
MERFGNIPKSQFGNEKSPFHPKSLYAIAKSAAYWLVEKYRNYFGLYACMNILFNHEYPLQPA